MAHHHGRNVTDRQLALDGSTPPASTPLILKGTIIPGGSRGPSQPRRAFEELLLEHCERILASGRSRKLVLQLELRFEGICPSTHEIATLRVADELLSNAMEHGHYARQHGHVFVHVISRLGVGVRVSVSDDGWGFDSGPIIDGNGFHLLRMIGDLYVGTAKTAPFVAKTTVTVIIPHHRGLAVTSVPARERGYEVKSIPRYIKLVERQHTEITSLGRNDATGSLVAPKSHGGTSVCRRCVLIS
jgi:hypothetical protein